MLQYVKIKNITKINNHSKRYDIQTQKNNNFFANNVLVHNSLCILYFYNNQWWFSTRSMPCAEGPLNTEMTFRDLISLTIQKMGYKDDEEFFQQFNSEYSYSFELTTPYNEVVVPQKECKLTLIGAWNVSTLEEINIHKLKLKVPIVEEYQITSLEACVRFVEEIQAHQGEGVVVKDKFGNRLKIKSPSYLAAHRAISISSTPRNQMELILSNAVDDVYTLLPDIIQESIDELKTKLNKLVDMTVKDYNEVKHHEVQKDFALAIVGKKLWTGALFNLRKGKTMDEIVHSTNIDTLLDLMTRLSSSNVLQ